MSFFKQLYDNFEEGACALFVAVMVLCLFLQVAMRIAVGSSLAWTEELSRYSFLWAVYVGAALAVKRGGHVRITAQFMFLPTRWRLVFRAVGASPFMWRGSGSPASKRACITPKCRLPSAL
jgi:TRAP-type C4-dicarboxylate transport system permease small subunit